MGELQRATAELIEDRPGLDEDLEAILSIDAENESWTFEEIPIDSGTFGELVSRSIVTETEGGEYELANRNAVEVAIGREQPPADGPSFRDLPTVECGIGLRTGSMAVIALLLLVLARIITIWSVYRQGFVVLLANDPYYYRYWVEQMTSDAEGAFQAAFSTSSMGPLKHGEPLLAATLSWITELLGGPDASGEVLAWYPIFAAVLGAGLLFLAITILTDDDRVALLAIVFLAITPEHALRTALGFADHHAFDFVWLMLTLLGIGLSEGRERSGGSFAPVETGLIAAGIAGQILAWEAGPILVAPISLYLVFRTSTALKHGQSSRRVVGPVVMGSGIAAIIVWTAHSVLGWHSFVVAITPALLFIGGSLILGIAEVADRIGRDPHEVLVGQVVTGIALLGVSLLIVPELVEELVSRLEFLFGASGIAESRSMFSPAYGSIFGPAIAFGTAFFLAVPYLAWMTRNVMSGESPEWTAPVVYSWWFLLLATIQFRFAGELAGFLAIFAGIGFVHLAYIVELTETPPHMLRPSDVGEWEWESHLPSRRTSVSLAVLFLLVAGLGVIQTPIQISKVVVDDGQVDAAAVTNDYVTEEDIDYPQSYVLSKWGSSRFYNYFVNGESNGYAYAARNYEAFLQSTRGGVQYRQLVADNRAGFVVTETLPDEDLSDRSLYVRLHEHWGSRKGTIPGLAHYRAVFAEEGSSVKVFQLVPGAEVSLPVASDETVTLRTDVTLADYAFVYERQARANPAGVVTVTVPYSGVYEIGGTNVSVPEDAVKNGTKVAAFEGPGAAWLFENESGEVAYETKSGNHGQIRNGTWVTGDNSSTIQFDGRGQVLVNEADIGVEETNTFALSVRFRPNRTADFEDDLPYPRIALHGSRTPFGETDGYQIAMANGQLVAVVGNGEDVVKLRGPRVDDGERHEVTLRRDGRTVDLVLDGTTVDTAKWDSSLEVEGSPFIIGYQFSGTIDHVTVTTENPSTANATMRLRGTGQAGICHHSQGKEYKPLYRYESAT